MINSLEVSLFRALFLAPTHKHTPMLKRVTSIKNAEMLVNAEVGVASLDVIGNKFVNMISSLNFSSESHTGS